MTPAPENPGICNGGPPLTAVRGQLLDDARVDGGGNRRPNGIDPLDIRCPDDDGERAGIERS